MRRICVDPSSFNRSIFVLSPYCNACSWQRVKLLQASLPIAPNFATENCSSIFIFELYGEIKVNRSEEESSPKWLPVNGFDQKHYPFELGCPIAKHVYVEDLGRYRLLSQKRRDFFSSGISLMSKKIVTCSR